MEATNSVTILGRINSRSFTAIFPVTILCAMKVANSFVWAYFVYRDRTSNIHNTVHCTRNSFINQSKAQI